MTAKETVIYTSLNWYKI